MFKGQFGLDGPMDLLAEEPAATGWREVAPYDVVAGLVAHAGAAVPVVAVDGRSGSGKSTLAEALAAAWPGAHVVRTDDVAWYESFLGWDALLREGVLEPVRRGELPVSYRPPAYDARNRPGAVGVPSGCSLLLVEGVGSSRRELPTCWTRRCGCRRAAPQRAGEASRGTWRFRGGRRAGCRR